jgi:hypothetical protein
MENSSSLIVQSTLHELIEYTLCAHCLRNRNVHCFTRLPFELDDSSTEMSSFHYHAPFAYKILLSSALPKAQRNVTGLHRCLADLLYSI